MFSLKISPGEHVLGGGDRQKVKGQHAHTSLFIGQPVSAADSNDKHTRTRMLRSGVPSSPVTGCLQCGGRVMRKHSRTRREKQGEHDCGRISRSVLLPARCVAFYVNHDWVVS